MANKNEHNRLITDAAKAVLSPLGCRRIGRSRTWISDQRFWAIQIEFQPGGWSKGSYLNVGAAWLWYPRKGLPFNWGYRVADFIPFESAKQFTPLIADMAAQAAQEVLALRKKFESLSDIQRNLVADTIDEGWPLYHAAVASGLVGDAISARRFFARMAAWLTEGYDWQERLKSDSAALAAFLDEPGQFRAAVAGLVAQCRALNKLSSDPHCLDSIIPIVERQ